MNEAIILTVLGALIEIAKEVNKENENKDND